MDLKILAWNVGILVAIGGVCAVVVGLAIGAANGGSGAASVVFNAGVFTLVLSTGVAAAVTRIDLRPFALAVGLLAGLGGFVTGISEPFLLIASSVALAGSMLAMRHPRAGIVLMLVPAVAGWLAAPSLYSIPARMLIGASLLLTLHLAWARFASGRPGTAALRELESRELSE